MSNKVLLVHPGTQHSYQLAGQLSTHECLYEFWTGFALAKNSWPTRMIQTSLPLSWRKKIANHIIADVPSSHLRLMPLLEWKALRRLQRGQSAQRVLHKRNQQFQEDIPASSLENSSAVIGFDTSSWIIAEKAKNLGKSFFLVQTIAHPLVNQATSQRLARRFPEWQTTLECRLPNVLACENQEHKLATKILAASTFTKQTLVASGVPAAKIIINPLGVELDLFRPPGKPRTRQPLRFLFLGAISARKGVPLLLEAWRSLGLKDCELWLVGPITSKEFGLIPKLPGLTLRAKSPYEDLPELMRQCDVLVFPSFCEGFARVLLEALATGMPIITTEATAGPDLIQDKKEGLLIPSGNLEALREAMKYFVDHPDDLETMSVAARRCAEKFSWNSYGDRWHEILREFV